MAENAQPGQLPGEDQTPEEIRTLVNALDPIITAACERAVGEQIKDLYQRSAELAFTDTEHQRHTDPAARTAAQVRQRVEEGLQRTNEEDDKRWHLEAMRTYLACKGDKREAIRLLEGMGCPEEVTQRAFRSDEQGSLGMLVPEEVRDIIVEFKREKNVIRQNIRQVFSVDSGTLTIGKQNNGAVAYWVAEGAAFTETEYDLADLTFTPRKLGALMTFTGELIRNLENLFTRCTTELAKAFKTAEDTAYLFGSGTNAQPLGIYNQMDATQKFTRTVAGGSGTNATIAEIRFDLVRMVASLMEGEHDIDMDRTRWVKSPSVWSGLMNKHDVGSGAFPFAREVEAGRLLGLPFDITNRIGADYTDGTTANQTKLFLIHYPEIAIGDGPSQGMQWTQDATIGGVPLFERDMQAIRMLESTDILMLYTDAAAVLEDVDWHLDL